MNVTISKRSQQILRVLAVGKALSRAAIEKAINETRINTIRELKRLVEQELVSTSGDARATVYTITEAARGLVIWNVQEYLASDPDKRRVRYTAIEPHLFTTCKSMVSTVYDAIIDALVVRQHRGDTTTTRKDLERFVVELSWKSSKIEGNTYTLLDTERLLKEGVTAPGHTPDEATMILNHKKAFAYLWDNQADFKHLTLQRIEEVHQLLVEGLGVDFGLRDEPVGITGTVYTPPASKVEIASYMHDIIDAINNLEDPLQRFAEGLSEMID